MRTHACSGREVADCSDGPSHSTLHLLYDGTRQASRAHAARMRLNASPPPVPARPPSPTPAWPSVWAARLCASAASVRHRCSAQPRSTASPSRCSTQVSRAARTHARTHSAYERRHRARTHARTQHGQRAQHGGHGRARGDDTVMHAALAGTDARACTHGLAWNFISMSARAAISRSTTAARPS
jgi:hypothetical protein